MRSCKTPATDVVFFILNFSSFLELGICPRPIYMISPHSEGDDWRRLETTGDDTARLLIGPGTSPSNRKLAGSQVMPPLVIGRAGPTAWTAYPACLSGRAPYGCPSADSRPMGRGLHPITPSWSIPNHPGPPWTTLDVP